MQNFGEKISWKWPLGRWRRLKDNVKTDPRAVGCDNERSIENNLDHIQAQPSRFIT